MLDHVYCRYYRMTLSTNISTDTQLINWMSIGWHISRQLVRCQLSIGRVSVTCQLGIGWYLSQCVCWSSNGWHIDRYSIDNRPILNWLFADILANCIVECWPIYQLCIGRYSADLPCFNQVDISADSVGRQYC